MNPPDYLISTYNDDHDRWHHDLWLYARTGVAHLSEDLVLLARPVNKDWPPEAITSGKSFHLTQECNTWYIHLAAGDMHRIPSISPYPLEWVMFERDGERLRAYKYDQIIRRL